MGRPWSSILLWAAMTGVTTRRSTHGGTFSERVPGTFADYVAVPKRNTIPLPDGVSALDASVLGTAWLTAYRALFTKSNLKPGETVLVQGASGGMSTALIQLGRAAGFEVWATSRNARGRELAEKLGAHRTFDANEMLPRKVQAVIDNIGPATWEHSMASYLSRRHRRHHGINDRT